MVWKEEVSKKWCLTQRNPSRTCVFWWEIEDLCVVTSQCVRNEMNVTIICVGPFSPIFSSSRSANRGGDEGNDDKLARENRENETDRKVRTTWFLGFWGGKSGLIWGKLDVPEKSAIKLFEKWEQKKTTFFFIWEKFRKKATLWPIFYQFDKIVWLLLIKNFYIFILNPRHFRPRAPRKNQFGKCQKYHNCPHFLYYFQISWLLKWCHLAVIR